MKAVIFSKFGGPEVLRYEELPDPIAQPDEVVVDVHAASVNGADYKVRQGVGPHKVSFPHILGRDFSGVVSEIGQQVTDFAVGDAVFGVLDQGIEGAYAEKVAVKAAIIAAKPDWLDHVTAAAMALTGITAIWAIEDTARLKPEETILVHGGAGGVGGFAVQLAHHLDAKVLSTTSTANLDFVKGLGAERVIDYTREDFTTLGQSCDVVFDTVGGEVQVRSYEVLKSGGRLIRIASAPMGFASVRPDVTVAWPGVLRDRAHLMRLLKLLESRAVVPLPVQRFDLSDAARAHRISENRHLQGKLVFEVVKRLVL